MLFPVPRLAGVMRYLRAQITLIKMLKQSGFPVPDADRAFNKRSARLSDLAANWIQL